MLSPPSLLIACPASDETIPSTCSGIVFGKRSRVKTLRSLPCTLQVQPRRKPNAWQQIELVGPLNLRRRGSRRKMGFRGVSGSLRHSSAEVVLRAGRAPSKHAIKKTRKAVGLATRAPKTSRSAKGSMNAFRAAPSVGAVAPPARRRDDGARVCGGDGVPPRGLDRLKSNKCILNAVRMAKKYIASSIGSLSPAPCWHCGCYGRGFGVAFGGGGRRL